MKYLFIDSSIWVRIISQGKPGCEIAHFDKLITCIEKSNVTLILPEVISLELEKNWRSFNTDVEVEINKLEKEVESLFKKSTWSEINDIQNELREFFANQKTKKVELATKQFERINKLLLSDKIVTLPFTIEIYLRGKKRLIAGKMPKPDNKSHSDACILESLALFFNSLTNKNDHELCFCSGNVGDFGLETKSGYIIHPLHKNDLPDSTVYSISLENVTPFLESEMKTAAPTQEIIEDAIQQRIEDEVETKFDLSTEHLSRQKCLEPYCTANKLVISKYCPEHYKAHLQRLSREEKELYFQTLNGLLLSLTYREREVIKLRTGLGDGRVYSLSDCAKIFKVSTTRIKQIEEKVRNRMSHPIRKQILDNYLI